MIADPTKRFTDRVDKYVKYRPTYPPQVITFLQKECHLLADAGIADVGSGTGIFTGLLLDKGYKVFAVEPNEAMQQAAIQQYGDNENFSAIDGTAEDTTLPANSIDLIVCAQAFHWFKEQPTQAEFQRILKPEGMAALIWNNRKADADEFSLAYESLLKQNTVEYNKVNHRNINEINFRAFFKDSDYKVSYYPNEQVFDEDGLLGRAFSSSYVPAEGTDEGKKFKTYLRDLFNRYNVDGKVSFHYQTEIYLGKI